MSNEDLTSSAGPADEPHSPVSLHTPKESPDMDTEMTCPLTPKDSPMTELNSPDQPEKMSSSFQSERDRNERNGRLINQNQAGPSNNLAQGQGAWRNSQMSPAHPAGSHHPAQYDPRNPTMGPFTNRDTPMLGENSVPLSTVRPGPIWPMQEQVDTSYAYGMRRHDGTYTRLLPADQYPMTGVPPRQGPEGLIIVPVPSQQEPNVSTPERMVPISIVQRLPPLTMIRPQGPSQDITQQRIDSIVHSSSIMSPPRREKIYCDKWIHEGVCAFTQLGCKYKHEMPMDKETQLTVGLNRGIPSWFRHATAIQLRESQLGSSMVSPPSTGKRIEGQWRRLDKGPPPAYGGGTQGHQVHLPVYGGAQGQTVRPRTYGGVQSLQVRPVGGNGAQHGRPPTGFGPIGPPQQVPSYVNANPYTSLKKDEAEDEDDDDDEMLYRGRHH